MTERETTTTTEQGPEALPLEREWSREMAEAEAVDAEPNSCYSNSFALVTSGLIAGALYCEGYAVAEGIGIPLGHAWVEVPEGSGGPCLLDPTYVPFSPDGAHAYFAAFKLDADALYAEVWRNGGNLPACDYSCELALATREASYRAWEHAAPGSAAVMRRMQDECDARNAANAARRAARTEAAS